MCPLDDLSFYPPGHRSPRPLQVYPVLQVNLKRDLEVRFFAWWTVGWGLRDKPVLSLVEGLAEGPAL
jgi:hypothetical protein